MDYPKTGVIAVFVIGLLVVIGGLSLLRLEIACIMGPSPFCPNVWNTTNSCTVIITIGLVLLIIGEALTARGAKIANVQSQSNKESAD